MGGEGRRICSDLGQGWRAAHIREAMPELPTRPDAVRPQARPNPTKMLKSFGGVGVGGGGEGRDPEAALQISLL